MSVMYAVLCKSPGHMLRDAVKKICSKKNKIKTSKHQ